MEQLCLSYHPRPYRSPLWPPNRSRAGGTRTAAPRAAVLTRPPTMRCCISPAYSPRLGPPAKKIMLRHRRESWVPHVRWRKRRLAPAQSAIDAFLGSGPAPLVFRMGSFAVSGESFYTAAAGAALPAPVTRRSAVGRRRAAGARGRHSALAAARRRCCFRAPQ